MSTGGQRRKMLLENARRNAKLFMKSKLGVVGLAIILFFLFIAVFAPFLTSNNPIYGTGVSADFSVPAWATVLPQYSNFPATENFVPNGALATQSDLAHWTLQAPGSPAGVASFSNTAANATYDALGINQTFVPKQTAANQLVPGQRVLNLSQTFSFSGTAPTQFTIMTEAQVTRLDNVSVLYINYLVSSPAKTFSLGSSSFFPIATEIAFRQGDVGNLRNITLSSLLIPASGNSQFPLAGNPGKIIFNASGTYTFTVQLVALATGGSASYSINLHNVVFHSVGSTYGLLGTDDGGRDLWSQFVYGAQISFLVGVVSAAGSVAVGSIVGLIAGLEGGWIDEVVSRITDFFLVIPFLPLAIVVIFILGQNTLLYKSIYYWIILLFVALSWPTVTRIVRSQVLTVKERQFVEASRALGGSNAHIMRKHILPNVLGLVYAQMALLVPGFILTEAALDFLAISTHPLGTITWGTMLTNALAYALTDASHQYVWWWFLPPGIAIAALSLAWVMVGYALDGVFNPKLRKR